MAVSHQSKAAPGLVKGIGLVAAVALMVTNAIGTGVFLKARVMICNVGTPEMVLLAYVVAGLFTLAGAMIYAELSTLMPRSGGPYNYIGAAFGRVWAFLYSRMETFIDGAATLMAAGLMVSSFGSLHSSVLTMARIPFAMARDGFMPSLLAKISRISHVPVNAVLLLGVCAIAFALSGTFDMLTDMIVFSVLIFEFLAVSAIFVLRKRIPARPGAFRAWGYPILPLVFLLATVLLTVNTLWALPGPSLAGLGLIALGLPVYVYYSRGRPRRQRRTGFLKKKTRLTRIVDEPALIFSCGEMRTSVKSWCFPSCRNLSNNEQAGQLRLVQRCLRS